MKVTSLLNVAGASILPLRWKIDCILRPAPRYIGRYHLAYIRRTFVLWLRKELATC